MIFIDEWPVYSGKHVNQLHKTKLNKLLPYMA